MLDKDTKMFIEFFRSKKEESREAMNLADEKAKEKTKKINALKQINDDY